MTYDIEFLSADEMKVPPYIDICPNGRVPTIVDPNTGITLWEVSRGQHTERCGTWLMIDTHSPEPSSSTSRTSTTTTQSSNTPPFPRSTTRRTGKTTKSRAMSFSSAKRHTSQWSALPAVRSLELQANNDPVPHRPRPFLRSRTLRQHDPMGPWRHRETIDQDRKAVPGGRQVHVRRPHVHTVPLGLGRQVDAQHQREL